MNGKIRISKISDSTKDEGSIRISLQDTTSKVQFIIIDMELDAFARVLFGIEDAPCELTFNNLKAIGKTKETKTFSIQTDRVCHLPFDKLNELFLDGWNAVLSSYKDKYNYKLNPIDSAYTFTAEVEFERFV